MQVDFYLSAASRYSYLASTQLDKISAQTGCEFLWKPLNNHALLSANGMDPFRSPAPVSGQYDWAYREYDAKCWAEYYDVPFVEPVNFRKDPPFIVRGCYAAESLGRIVPFCRRLSAAIFVEGRVIDQPLLSDFAEDVGIDRSDFEHAFGSEQVAGREKEVLDAALSKNVFGVPTFVSGDKLFWGNDRIPLLLRALEG